MCDHSVRWGVKLDWVRSNPNSVWLFGLVVMIPVSGAGGPEFNPRGSRLYISTDPRVIRVIVFP